MYGFVAGFFLANVLFKLDLYFMFLVTITATLLGEVEEHSMSLD